MTVLVGLVPDDRYLAPLRLGVSMALSSGLPLKLCTIVSGANPGLNSVDVEYLQLVEQSAATALEELTARIADEVTVGTVVRRARSVSSGLIEAAEQQHAHYLVVGSSPSGALGRIALGSVSDRLLHTSPVPVAVAPRGYDSDSRTRINRLTVAFGGHTSSDLVVAAANRAAELGADLRIASFHVHPVALFGSMIATGPQSLIVDRWAAQRREEMSASLATAQEALNATVDVVIGQGNSWGEAVSNIPWRVGDVLVVGSGHGGPSRVFVGSHASKIIRQAPVPVICVPGSE